MTEPEPAEVEVPPSSYSPGKILRIGGMVRQVLEELNASELDQEALESLHETYLTSVEELKTSLPTELSDELDRLSAPFRDATDLTGAELKLAEAQLLGWLDGLLGGLSVSLALQQRLGKGEGGKAGQYL